jgi:hypothetical protein
MKSEEKVRTKLGLVHQNNKGYYRLGNNKDRAAAVSMIASSRYGRVEVAVDINWTEGSGLEAKKNHKTVSFSDELLERYTQAPSYVYKITFTGIDSLEGSVTAVPTFLVRDPNGAVMMTLAGTVWTIK